MRNDRDILLKEDVYADQVGEKAGGKVHQEGTCHKRYSSSEA